MYHHLPLSQNDTFYLVYGRNSLCAFCAWTTVVSICEIPLHAPATEARLPRLQHPHARAWPVEVSVYGPASHGDGRLARVRESWTSPGDIVILDTFLVNIHCLVNIVIIDMRVSENVWICLTTSYFAILDG